MVKAVEEADLPPGVVNLITGPGGSAGEEMAQHPLVDKVAFTGSTEVGRRIMQLASGTVKKVTLELGGKSANIVLDDADLDLAAAGVLWGTFFHNGQVCESGTRALVSRKIYDEFVGMLVERAGKIVIGDNMDMATDLGPLVSPSQVDTTERYVKLGLDEGAKLLCGGSKPTNLAAGLDQSAYYLPDDLRGRQLDEDRAGGDLRSGVVRDPVRLRRRGDQDRERLDLRSRRRRVVEEPRARALGRGGMRTGTVWINDYHMITPTQPFGGYKQSGIGRELGDYGYNEYRQIKHVWQNTATDRNGYLHFAALSGNI